MLDLFLNLFKISLFSFGGGSVILSLIQKEFVENGIIESSLFVNAVAMSQATPGPIAGSISTYIGYNLYGLTGAVISNIAIALPSFAIVIIISNFIVNKKYSNIFNTIYVFLRPIAVALIASVLIFFINTAVYNGKLNYYSIFQFININALIIISILFIILYKFKLSPVEIIISSALLGILLL